ncbi:DUF2783 domain-containing protein [Stappia sp. F7233]|uniref:DUF2783 domain-containing protein n=1 Tax=Stappia albiluteola TaxID=2758565 RepID=A0A839AIK2_9HYPH|nr:DUF2783 domain-containing protein [Stappia albiluteola]MBA5778752.1 DUF2783 domain-containing protein [Stappia albiluteola]
MSELQLKANLSRPDDFYAALLAAHEGLSKAESDALNARLILILANHIGDQSVLKQALSAALAARHPAGGNT